MPYPEELVAPMRAEAVRAGARELRTAAEVDAFRAQARGTTLLLVNSVCGCAAGAARPGVAAALRHAARPDQVVTVFAGQDAEATARARAWIGEQVPPSSPSIALFRDGALVHFVPRHQIEGRDAAGVAALLVEAFDAHCGPAGRR
jgi:putative YphP/YqiW family bacilliredoxin